MSSVGLRDLLDKQVGLWLTVADALQVPLHHIKLHGSLYHAVNREQNLAETLVLWMSQNTPNARIYAPSQGALIQVAQQHPHELWPELFADRAYSADGFLVERAEEGAVLTDPDQVLARLDHWRITGELMTNANTWIRVQAKTVCVHGDTPDAVVLAQRIRAWTNQWDS
jgi:UPF0271 protein